MAINQMMRGRGKHLVALLRAGLQLGVLRWPRYSCWPAPGAGAWLER